MRWVLVSILGLPVMLSGMRMQMAVVWDDSPAVDAAYPCQFHQCGCINAKICRTRCCCFKPKKPIKRCCSATGSSESSPRSGSIRLAMTTASCSADVWITMGFAVPPAVVTQCDGIRAAVLGMILAGPIQTAWDSWPIEPALPPPRTA